MKISGSGTRKIGRNKDKCAKYKQEHKLEKNKLRKYKKMLKKLQDNSSVAMNIKNKINQLEKKILGI